MAKHQELVGPWKHAPHLSPPLNCPQEVLRWLNAVEQILGDAPTKEQLTEFVWATLKSGKVRRSRRPTGGVLHLVPMAMQRPGSLQIAQAESLSCCFRLRRRWCPALATPCCARPIPATPASASLPRSTSPTTTSSSWCPCSTRLSPRSSPRPARCAGRAGLMAVFLIGRVFQPD